MLEFEKRHKRGGRTFFYIFVRKGWPFCLLGVGIIYVAWLMYFGGLNAVMTNFLAQHPDWYIDVPMLSEWLLLLGISILIFTYIRISVIYQNYKFMLDEYAVHLHRGLFFVQEITIPYQQISNVHIGRPYHYRILGLAQLDIVTAADADKNTDMMENKTKKFLIPTIDVSIARQLSRQLLENASKIRKGQNVYPDDEDIEDDMDENEEELSDEDSD